MNKDSKGALLTAFDPAALEQAVAEAAKAAAERAMAEITSVAGAALACVRESAEALAQLRDKSTADLRREAEAVISGVVVFESRHPDYGAVLTGASFDTPDRKYTYFDQRFYGYQSQAVDTERLRPGRYRVVTFFLPLPPAELEPGKP